MTARVAGNFGNVRTVLHRIGWITASHIVTSALRLLNNIILAWLLAPALFGLMLIINLVRTGIELLTDVGIGQNIVSSENGRNPDFYDTAWTIQALRGLILGVVCVASANLFAELFDKEELRTLLPFAALFSIVSGFSSISTFLVQKNINVQRYGKFEIALAVGNVAIYTVLALITKTIWALIIGTVISFCVLSISTYFLIPGIRHRFYFDKVHAREILVFGKWIFWSSMIGFLAMNFDRLYFAKYLSLTQLGIYGIARNLAETISTLAVRYGNLLLFPMVAEMKSSGGDVRGRLRRGRGSLLLATAFLLAGLVAVSDTLIILIYPVRYEQAAVILPVLLIGVWFAILSTLSEYLLLGIGSPANVAFGNTAKLISSAVLAALGFHFFGFAGAIVGLVAAEIAKYVVLWLSSLRARISFARDDLFLTGFFAVSIVIIRLALSNIGLTTDLDHLFPWVHALAGAA